MSLTEFEPPAAFASPDATSQVPQTPGLSNRRKAALVVQMMIAQGCDLSLKNLPHDVQLSLAREIGTLRIVDRHTLHAVADEFSDVLDSIGLTSPGGVHAALKALADQISPEAAARLQTEEAQRRIARDPWAQITQLDIPDMVTIMQDESIEVAAVVLSKLPVAKAAQLLSQIPGPLARQITFAVSHTSGILPAAVRRIGQAVAQAHCMKPIPAFASKPDARVGAILDSSRTMTRDDVLDGLDETDPAFADQVRRAIFTFADITTRVRAIDLPNVTRAIDNAVFITAMAHAFTAGGSDAEAAEFILGSMSKRMSEQLRDELAERGKVRKSDGESAMRDVILVIREAVDAGQINLVEVDEDDEE